MSLFPGHRPSCLSELMYSSRLSPSHRFTNAVKESADVSETIPHELQHVTSDHHNLDAETGITAMRKGRVEVCS